MRYSLTETVWAGIHGFRTLDTPDEATILADSLRSTTGGLRAWYSEESDTPPEAGSKAHHTGSNDGSSNLFRQDR